MCIYFLATGSTINLAIKVLKEHGVIEDNILVLCLFSTPTGKIKKSLTFTLEYFKT